MLTFSLTSQPTKVARHAGVRMSRTNIRVHASKPSDYGYICETDVKAEAKGSPESLDYRVYFKDAEGNQISPWHDISIVSDDWKCWNFVCEIPKDTSAKMEVALDEVNNPIKQDTKDGKLRYYPYNINWNYGCIPQTWEDPEVEDKELGYKGDNDPIDVVEIGSKKLETGGVYNVKGVGVLAMIDEGELDWKVIAICRDDPKAESINDIEDVERVFPGEIDKIRTWFRDYKTPDGKPQNEFAYEEKCMDRMFTRKVINKANDQYGFLKYKGRENTYEHALP